MQYYVYILYSPSLEKFYAGISRFPEKRLRQHRKGQSGWTKRADDWQHVWQIERKNSSEARLLEKKIKKRGIKRFIVDNDIAVPPTAE